MTRLVKRHPNIPRLIQPVDDKGGWICILRPGAFFWTAGRLYVGYARLSCLHPDEEPLWDREPVELGTIIETRGGFYQFIGVLHEGEPYRRKYAQLQFAYVYQPDDFGWGFLKKNINQGSIPIHEKYVLAPNTYMEAQWLSDALLHKKWCNGRNLERKIRRCKPIADMRTGDRATRRSLEEQFSDMREREQMIRQYAVPAKAWLR